MESASNRDGIASNRDQMKPVIVEFGHIPTGSELKCPRCGMALITRMNKITKDTFYSCTMYPRCNYSKPVEVKEGE